MKQSSYRKLTDKAMLAISPCLVGLSMGFTANPWHSSTLGIFGIGLTVVVTLIATKLILE